MTVWILGPSVLWSLVFQQVFFCVDPLLLHPVERTLPRWLSLALRAAWVLGFAGALLFAWNIPPQAYGFYLREALPFSPTSVLVSLGVVSLFLIWFLLYRTRRHESVLLARMMLVSGVVLLALKSLSSVGMLQVAWIQDYVRSPVLGFGRMVVEMRHDIQTPVNEAYGATFYSYVRAQPALPPKIVLMVVESWGETASAVERMASEIRSTRRQVLSSGLTTYRGSTLSGEFRELCAKDLMPTGELTNVSPRFECAPVLLQRKGYQVTGLHGYKRFFYARDTFWKRFGISHAEFREDLIDLVQCPGPFEGVCDSALVKRGTELLDKDGKRFIYMLSLSSHEPVAPSALRTPGAFFGGVEVVHPTQVVSRRAVSDLLVVLDGRAEQSCTLVYVAGDHQPPSATGKQIFESGKVPFIVFSHNCPTPPPSAILTAN